MLVLSRSGLGSGLEFMAYLFLEIEAQQLSLEGSSEFETDAECDLQYLELQPSAARACRVTQIPMV